MAARGLLSAFQFSPIRLDPRSHLVIRARARSTKWLLGAASVALFSLCFVF